MSGDINIKMLALNLKNDESVEMFSKLDHYVVFKTKDNFVKTNVKENAGKFSEWHEQFQVRASNETQLFFTIFDRSILHLTVKYLR